MKDPQPDDNKKQLLARIDRDVKEKFDRKRKVRGLKQEYIVEQLIKKWVDGQIEI